MFSFFNSGIFEDTILDKVQPESRASFAPLISLDRESRTRTMSHKAAGTLLSRQRHFLTFLSSINLPNNVVLLGFSILTRNVIIACYAATLSSRNIIQYKNISVSTILKYVSTASALSFPFQVMNSLVNIYGKKSQLIKDIKHEAKRWESMPNRRKPLTMDMVKFLIKKSAALNLPDDKYNVMTD